MYYIKPRLRLIILQINKFGRIAVKLTLSRPTFFQTYQMLVNYLKMYCTFSLVDFPT